jgi:hypothetical protein
VGVGEGKGSADDGERTGTITRGDDYVGGGGEGEGNEETKAKIRWEL